MTEITAVEAFGLRPDGSSPDTPLCDHVLDREAALNALTEDGATYLLDDGRVLRLRELPDEHSSINDYDSDGRVSNTYSYLHGEAHTPRPEGFDGRAVKIEVDRGYWAWWQPPGPDLIGDTPWTPEQFKAEKARVTDLVQFGFVGLILQLCEGRDYHGELIVRNEASLWGLEWNILSDRNDYSRDVISDLIDELEIV